MNLKPEQDNWFFKYISPRTELNHYKDLEGNNYKLSTQMAATLLLPLVKDKYRYEPTLRVWYEFNGTRWVDTTSVYRNVVDTLNDLKMFYERPPAGVGPMTPVQRLDRIHNDTFVPRTLEILQKFNDTHVHLGDFDTDPDILNTPGGVYNLLKGGDPAPNSPLYLCKQVTAIAPLDDEDGKNCPNYMNHLNYVFEGDQTLIDWCEDVSGYIISGHTFMQQFYWFCGLSGTGKSSIANIWAYILQDADEGGYAWCAPNDQFSIEGKGQHKTYDLKLAGKRYVVTDELKGNRWDEAKLKNLMGGGRISANAMHTNPVSFEPICKLLFTSNHEPTVDAQDGGMARRLRLYPFSKVIHPDRKIEYFDRIRLRPEAPYILNRMIKRANKVLQARTIITPNKVMIESQRYFNSNNWLGQFIEDACTTGKGLEVTNKQLHLVCTLWCNENGYDPPSMHQLGKLLERALYRRVRLGNNRGHEGIALNHHYAAKVKF